MATRALPASPWRRRLRTAAWATLLAAGFAALGFASVPLYRMFCQATGWNGTVQERLNAVAPGAVPGRIVTVRFDANVAPHMPWRFQPDQRTLRVAVGARELAFFTAVNDSDRPVTGSAAFNVSPPQVGQYFVKIQCFCFTEQTLRPHERVRMPVIFYVDPGFARDPDAGQTNEITLSYTFYPVAHPAAAG